MKEIVQAFYSEPVVVLGVAAISAPVLVEQSVIAGWVGTVAVAVVAVLQRHFVTPERKRR